MRLGGTYAKSRMLATGKTVYVRLQRGQLIACKWPKKRPRVTHPTTLDQMERFRQANWLAKYAPAPIQMAHRRLVDGTQLLPRDLMVAAMLGRGMWPQLPGELKRYPVAAIRDLSDTLDILGAQPSDILARGPDRWQVSSATQQGQALISGAPGQAPSWQTLSGGGGLWQQIEDVTLPSALAVNAYQEVTIPSNAQSLEFNIYTPSVAGGITPAIRFNADAGANYNVINRRINSAAAQAIARLTAQSELRVMHSAGTPNALATWTRGSFQQPTSDGSLWLQLALITDLVTSNETFAQWTPSPAAPLAKIGFASTAVNGLPAGTRIIVRAIIP